MKGGAPFTALLLNVLIGAAFLSIAACAGNGDGLDANGRPLTPGESSGPIPLSDDFDSLQANIFTPICSVCHAGAAAPEGLRLDSANAYHLLVSVPSTEVPTVLRVAPGDPDNSYIIQKLEGHAAVGARMPFGGPYLSTATIAFVREWITNGAPASNANAVPAAFAVTSLVPAMDEAVMESPAQIMVAVNHDLDLSRIDLSAARIEKMQPGAPMVVVESMPARISVSSANLKALMIWPERPLSIGRYRVVFRTSMPALNDLSGQSILVGMSDAAGDSVLTTFDIRATP
jgi:hypothetical protein